MAAGGKNDQPAGTPPADGENADMDLIHTGPGDGTVIELDERVRAQLGRQLSKYYNSLVQEPVPDKFLELLKRLDMTEKGS